MDVPKYRMVVLLSSDCTRKACSRLDSLTNLNIIHRVAADPRRRLGLGALRTRSKSSVNASLADLPVNIKTEHEYSVPGSKHLTQFQLRYPTLSRVPNTVDDRRMTA